LSNEGLQRTGIAKCLEIGVASVFRILADAKKVDGGKGAA
jgi:hypothetical protein